MSSGLIPFQTPGSDLSYGLGYISDQSWHPKQD